MPAAAGAGSPHVVLDVQAAAGQSAAAAMGNLSLGAAAHPAKAVASAGAASAAAGTVAAASQPSTAAAAAGQASQQLRQQEVVDDEEEEAGWALGDGTASTAAATAGLSGLPGQSHPHQPEEQEEEEEGDPSCTYVWDSSSRQPEAATALPPTATSAGTACNAAAELKKQGNACLKAGDCEAAVRCYTQALAARSSQQQGGEQAQPGAGQQVQVAAVEGAGTGAADPLLLATLHSNRAQALLKLKRHEEVSEMGWGTCWRLGNPPCYAKPDCQPRRLLQQDAHCTA